MNLSLANEYVGDVTLLTQIIKYNPFFIQADQPIKNINVWMIIYSGFFSPTMKERKLIVEMQDTIWILIIHAMIAKWLNYTIKFNFTSCFFYVHQSYRPERTNNALEGGARRKLIRGCSENKRKWVIFTSRYRWPCCYIIFDPIHHLTVIANHRGNPYFGLVRPSL